MDLSSTGIVTSNTDDKLFQDEFIDDDNYGNQLKMHEWVFFSYGNSNVLVLQKNICLDHKFCSEMLNFVYIFFKLIY